MLTYVTAMQTDRDRSLTNVTFYRSYGLLGASGCGKTTVLSCVVGCRTLDKGRISVFGGIPGDRRTGVPGKRVGYMPQVGASSFMMM